MAPTLTPEERELWRLTMEHSPVGMALLTPDGRYVRVNPAMCAMVGYTEEELTGLTFHHVTHPDDLFVGVQLHQEMLTGTTGSYRVRKRYVRPDGVVVPVDLSMAVQRNDDGSPHYFITQVVDLSETHHVEQRLGLVERQVVDEQLRVRAILDTDVVGLALIDLDGTFQAVNATQQGFFDLAFPDGHTGRVGSQGFIYDADQSRLLEPHEIPSSRAARGEELDNYLCWAGPDPATRRALVISARNVPDSEGRRSGSAMVFHDVTDMMRAVRAKNDFVSSVSHELRTPLTSALGHLELLGEHDDLSAEHRRHVEVALRNVLRLSHMVADVLFVSSAAAGPPLFDRHEVDLVGVVRDAVCAVAAESRACDVAISTRLPGSLCMTADGLRLRQVVDNLLVNAVTFSHGETVTVSLEERGADIVLTVADTGEGLEADELSEAFERFFRGRSALARQVPGAGLGLTTVRTIVEAHGGSVTMASVPGEGCTVQVRLPR